MLAIIKYSVLNYHIMLVMIKLIIIIVGMWKWCAPPPPPERPFCLFVGFVFVFGRTK